MKNTIVICSSLLILFVALNFAFTGSFSGKRTCKKISGIVTSIYEDGAKDAVFKLEGHNSVFYINRGFEKTFNLGTLLEKLMGKEVNIMYPDNSTALGSISESRHISELHLGQELVYSEFEEK